MEEQIHYSLQWSLLRTPDSQEGMDESLAVMICVHGAASGHSIPPKAFRIIKERLNLASIIAL